MGRSMFTVLQEVIGSGCAATVKKKKKKKAYVCLDLLLGVTRIPSTGFPAERSDPLSAQGALARGIFQVPQ